MTPVDAPTRYQRLTLGDLAGLVAASGVAMGLWVVHARDVSYDSDKKYFVPESVPEWINFGSDWALALAWLVVLRGVAQTRPRAPTFGSVACLAALLVTSFVAMHETTEEYHEIRVWDLASLGHHALLSYAYSAWRLDAICGSVVLGWIILGRLGGWRRASGPLDRLGRGVGCWFLIAFAIKTIIEIWALIARARAEAPPPAPSSIFGPFVSGGFL